jgi:hypothetical protein
MPAPKRKAHCRECGWSWNGPRTTKSGALWRKHGAESRGCSAPSLFLIVEVQRGRRTPYGRAIVKPFCAHGHPRTPENVYGDGQCRACAKLRDAARPHHPEYQRAYRQRRKERLGLDAMRAIRREEMRRYRERKSLGLVESRKPRASSRPATLPSGRWPCCGHPAAKHDPEDGLRCYSMGCDCEGPKS